MELPGVPGTDRHRRRELRQVFIEVVLALFHRRVQYLEKLAQPQTSIAAVRVGALGDEAEKMSLVSKIRCRPRRGKHKAHEEPLQVVALVAGILQGVVERAHHLGGFDIDWVLVSKRPLLNAENKAKILYMSWSW